RYLAQAREREAAGDPAAALAALEKAALLGKTPEIEGRIALLQEQVQEGRRQQEAREREEALRRREAERGKPPVSVSVSAPAAPPMLNRARRPTWRVVLGALSIAGGLTLSGLGAGALSVDGQCGPSPGCAEVYATAGVGGGFLGSGL